MKLTKIIKPIKKNDMELWGFIEEAIQRNDYVFVTHAQERQYERDILDIDVLDILQDKPNRKRKRNKNKDRFDVGYKDWKYCIEGNSLDGDKIRLIVTFDEQLMLVITVIRVGKSG